MAVLCDCHMGAKASWKCFKSLHTHKVWPSKSQGLPEPCLFRSQLGLQTRVSSSKSNLRSCPSLSSSAQYFKSLRSRQRDLAGSGPSPTHTTHSSCAKQSRVVCIRAICAGVSLCQIVHKLPSHSVGHLQPRAAQGHLLPPHANKEPGSQGSKSRESHFSYEQQVAFS